MKLIFLSYPPRKENEEAIEVLRQVLIHHYSFRDVDWEMVSIAVVYQNLSSQEDIAHMFR